MKSVLNISYSIVTGRSKVTVANLKSLKKTKVRKLRKFGNYSIDHYDNFKVFNCISNESSKITTTKFNCRNIAETSIDKKKLVNDLKGDIENDLTSTNTINNFTLPDSNYDMFPNHLNEFWFSSNLKG